MPINVKVIKLAGYSDFSQKKNNGNLWDPNQKLVCARTSISMKPGQYSDDLESYLKKKRLAIRQLSSNLRTIPRFTIFFRGKKSKIAEPQTKLNV